MAGMLCQRNCYSKLTTRLSCSPRCTISRPHKQLWPWLWSTNWNLYTCPQLVHHYQESAALYYEGNLAQGGQAL